MVKLEEMVGKGKAGEEPEGEVIVGPSGEAVELCSGNVPSFLSFFSKSNSLFNYTPLFLSEFLTFFDLTETFPCMSGLVSLKMSCWRKTRLKKRLKWSARRSMMWW